MEGWDGQANWNRDVLERIVALLFALAGLADLAAGAPFHRRRLVLEILSHGEAEARAFVIGIATGAPVPADAVEPSGQVARLAASFRALALVLCVLLARRFSLSGAAGPRVRRQGAAEPAGRHAAPSAPDTS